MTALSILGTTICPSVRLSDPCLLLYGSCFSSVYMYKLVRIYLSYHPLPFHCVSFQTPSTPPLPDVSSCVEDPL